MRTSMLDISKHFFSELNNLLPFPWRETLCAAFGAENHNYGSISINNYQQKSARSILEQQILCSCTIEIPEANSAIISGEFKGTVGSPLPPPFGSDFFSISRLLPV